MKFKKVKNRRLIINLILLSSFFNLYAQEFSVEDIFRMTKNQKLFEYKMMQTDFTLTKIDASKFITYQTINDDKNTFNPSRIRFTEKSFYYSTPTNDISKKDNKKYTYVKEKIRGIQVEQRRSITYAENYNLNENLATTWFTHSTEYVVNEKPSTNNLKDFGPSNSMEITFAGGSQDRLYSKLSHEITTKWNYIEVMKFGDNAYMYVYKLNNNGVTIIKYNDGSITVTIRL